MFNGFVMPTMSRQQGGNTSKVALKDRIYGVGFTPNEPVRLTTVAGHKIVKAKIVNSLRYDRLGNPFTKPVVVLELEGTSGYGLRTYWSNAPMGTKVAERDLDVAKLVEFSASQDGVLHCDSNGEAIMYASDEAPKARITED